MSEFAHEHADQRLIGAPPGYVGYDIGGELTNSIKQNPFSVVLFDEIEKAHRKIFDLFLQILDDGRLTSGRGETVYFSESLIIFTSNLGIYETAADGTKKILVSPQDSYEAVRETVNRAIQDFFTYNIGRPEILNRIGENIVVFDFIRSENGTAQAIFNKMLNCVLARLEETHKISLQWENGVKERLLAHTCENLNMGGRGIGNALERIFINPMSRALFETKAQEGESFKVTELTQEDGIWCIGLARPSS
jgi:ATP-dependent Clp protease ATP-binding subunit ClpA